MARSASTACKQLANIRSSTGASSIVTTSQFVATSVAGPRSFLGVINATEDLLGAGVEVLEDFVQGIAMAIASHSEHLPTVDSELEIHAELLTNSRDLNWGRRKDLVCFMPLAEVEAVGKTSG